MPLAVDLSWQEITGWFDFEALYQKIVREARAGAVLVEVGCYLGRSIAFLGDESRRSGKELSIYGVEHGRGGVTVPSPDDENIAPQFVLNMQRCGLLDYVFPIIAPSHRASALFADGSVDFVFIDAEHTYESVIADLTVWWPKIRPGGLLAGHDYSWPEVARAVEKFFGRPDLYLDFCPQCWGITKVDEPT